MTDEALMRAVRDGEVHHLSVLFERYHQQLFRFFHRMVDNRANSEDLVHDVFVRALKYRHTYRDHVTFAAWLFRIARNARLDFVRKHAVLDLLDEEMDVPTPGPGPAVRLEQHEQVALLHQALRRLPADKRELIVLARWHDMNYAQLGEIMGAEPGTIRVRLHRAIRQLEAIFDRLQGEARDAM